MNEGLGEGVSYRARLLLGFKTEILDNSETGPSMVEVESCSQVAEVSKIYFVKIQMLLLICGIWIIRHIILFSELYWEVRYILPVWSDTGGNNDR